MSKRDFSPFNLNSRKIFFLPHSVKVIRIIAYFKAGLIITMFKPHPTIPCCYSVLPHQLLDQVFTDMHIWAQNKIRMKQLQIQLNIYQSLSTYNIASLHVTLVSDIHPTIPCQTGICIQEKHKIKCRFFKYNWMFLCCFFAIYQNLPLLAYSSNHSLSSRLDTLTSDHASKHGTHSRLLEDLSRGHGHLSRKVEGVVGDLVSQTFQSTSWHFTNK